MTNLVSFVETILEVYQNDSLKVSVRTQGAQQLPYPLTTYMCQFANFILFFFLKKHCSTVTFGSEYSCCMLTVIF